MFVCFILSQTEKVTYSWGK